MIPYPIQTNTSIEITAATNATPIVCTTDVHGFTTGDTVNVTGVPGNTNANVQTTVTVLSTTTFSLDGTAGNADSIGVGGRAEFNPSTRTYPAVTSLTGDEVILSTDVKQADEFNFFVDADKNPVTGGQELTVKVLGRPSGNSEWFTLATIDNTSTWTAGIDDATRYVSKSLNIPIYPLLRIDVVAFGASSTTLKAWINL